MAANILLIDFCEESSSVTSTVRWALDTRDMHLGTLELYTGYHPSPPTDTQSHTCNRYPGYGGHPEAKADKVPDETNKAETAGEGTGGGEANDKDREENDDAEK